MPWRLVDIYISKLKQKQTSEVLIQQTRIKHKFTTFIKSFKKISDTYMHMCT
jgi:hypothetical protein